MLTLFFNGYSGICCTIGLQTFSIKVPEESILSIPGHTVFVPTLLSDSHGQHANELQGCVLVQRALQTQATAGVHQALLYHTLLFLSPSRGRLEPKYIHSYLKLLYTFGN